MGAMEGAGNRGASRVPAVHATKAAREMRAGRSESGQVREEYVPAPYGAGTYEVSPSFAGS